MSSLSLLQQIFLNQELNQGLLRCRRILYQLSYEGWWRNSLLSIQNRSGGTKVLERPQFCLPGSWSALVLFAPWPSRGPPDFLSLPECGGQLWRNHPDFLSLPECGGQIWRNLEQLSGVSDDRIPSPVFWISFSGCKALTAFPKQPVPLLETFP